MYEIDSFGSIGGQWTNGNPATSTPATRLDAPWFNAIQAEIVNVVEAAGLTPDKNDSTQLLQALQGLLGAVPGTRNLLINGDFAIAQRRKSASLSVAGGALTGFVCDRWLHGADTGVGTGVAGVSRMAFSVGQTAVPGDPKYFLRHQQSTAATAGNPTVAQKIEGVRGQDQGSRTVSVYLKGLSSFNVTARVVQNFGTGGSPSSPVIVGTGVFAVTTTWTRFQLTVAMPSISGKTIGTANNDHLLIELQLPMGATYTLDLARAQTEIGAVAGTFEVRPLTQELALCQRYYEKSYEFDTDPATDTQLGSKQWQNWASTSSAVFPDAAGQFKVEKRATPGVTWYGYGTGGAQPSAQVNVAGANLTVSGTSNISRRVTGYPTTTVAGGFGIGGAHWTADAEL